MATTQDPSRPAIILPPEVHSVCAAKPVAGSIKAEQPNFPAEMTRAYRNDSNWLYLARIASRTATPITEQDCERRDFQARSTACGYG
jgi:hypothetical protein